MEHYDCVILEKIINYCDRIEQYLQSSGNSSQEFCKNPMLQDACCMCIIQIGELAGSLSENAKHESPDIPWRVIKDTRNFYVHAYGSIDLNAVWNTVINDIPPLKEACKKLLKAASSL